MMFNLGHDKIHNMLNSWWKEIDSGSYRDQLSFNYAVSKHNAKLHKIMDTPFNVRNHPKFSLSSYHGQNKINEQIINALNCQVVNPYYLPSYSSFKDSRIRKATNEEG